MLQQDSSREGSPEEETFQLGLGSCARARIQPELTPSGSTLAAAQAPPWPTSGQPRPWTSSLEPR